MKKTSLTKESKSKFLICEEIAPTGCVNRPFPNLILFKIFLFRLYFTKFVNSLLNYPQKKICLPLFPVILLRIFDLEFHCQLSLKVASVTFGHVFVKFRKLKGLHLGNKNSIAINLSIFSAYVIPYLYGTKIVFKMLFRIFD